MESVRKRDHLLSLTNLSQPSICRSAIRRAASPSRHNRSCRRETYSSISGEATEYRRCSTARKASQRRCQTNDNFCDLEHNWRPCARRNQQRKAQHHRCEDMRNYLLGEDMFGCHYHHANDCIGTRIISQFPRPNYSNFPRTKFTGRESRSRYTTITTG